MHLEQYVTIQILPWAQNSSPLCFLTSFACLQSNTQNRYCYCSDVGRWPAEKPPCGNSDLCISWKKKSTGAFQSSFVSWSTKSGFPCLFSTNLSVVSTVHQPLARLRACSDEEPRPQSSWSLQSRRRGTKNRTPWNIISVHRHTSLEAQW